MYLNPLIMNDGSSKSRYKIIYNYHKEKLKEMILEMKRFTLKRTKTFSKMNRCVCFIKTKRVSKRQFEIKMYFAFEVGSSLSEISMIACPTLYSFLIYHKRHFQGFLPINSSSWPCYCSRSICLLLLIISRH